MTNSNLQQNNKMVAYWLIAVSVVVFCMIILGGVTRLTVSGLSMVDWKPLMGIFPPTSEIEWMEVFERYKQFPEYQKVNIGMTLEGFKSIFYFEYFHRLLGRLIGLVFIVPLIIFWIRGTIAKPLIPKMLILFVLGGLQGVLGWFMVKSGLVDNPRVSQYRLTAHLMAAVLLYGYMLWVAFTLLTPEKITARLSDLRIARWSVIVSSLILFMIATGGFVAGTKAGLVYNTFPLMGDSFIPPGLYEMQPFWMNWFENMVTIQFNHRIFAYLLLLIIPAFAVYLIKQDINREITIASYALIAMLLIQVGLGIATILYHVPVTLGASHQGGAVILLTISLFITQRLRSIQKSS
ncbi:MAG: COX15/CtaA family protein [Gammaproteobacteria bacterium]|nr:COX15/CtaA family protein [Gammaproteobacteria bacterium]MDH5631278.1 COX15/CtaA family protein [Gammaproteobacteria bacterium]